jgi:ABC-type dipeptide/oligopeptide/nickel transport system permease subunit
MVSSKGVKFNLKRVAGTLRLLLKNKMAIFGLVILSAFIFAALAAPLLVTNQPGQKVAGILAQPEWVTNFPDGYYLSKNIVDPNINAITTPSSLQSWTLTASPQSLANIQEIYQQGVKFLPSSQGSIELVHTGTTPGTVTLTESFNFPYHGPPAEFIAHIHYMLTGASAKNPVGVRLFIQRSDQIFNLVNENDTTSGQWLPPPSITLDSASPTLQDYLGTTPTGFTPPQIIFSATQSYTYGLQITFYGNQKVNIDDFQMVLLGTAYGLFGTDFGGGDVYSSTVYGSRISLLVGLLAAGIGISLGLVVGMMAGFLGKFVDEVLMRFTDMMLVIPGLPLLIVLVAVLGPNIWNLILVIGFLGWMGFARIVRSQVLSIRERPFVEAARASGAGPGRIIVKHVFPNIVSLTYVNLALTVPGAILSEAALSFLGLGDPSVVSWGNMFQHIESSQALQRVPPVWWWVLPPGFGIALVSLSFILIGYALDEVFNPRLRKRR